MCTQIYVQRDLALGVPGIFTVVRCSACGLIYQNPRVSSAALAFCYPANYPPHLREPDLSLRLSRVDAGVRWVLARYLGYAHLGRARPGWRMRLRALCRFRRIRHDFPPFLGQGRLLDVGCATGRFLSRMAEVGWSPAGIEFDPEAAAKAARISQRVFVGDPTEAPFPPRALT